MGDCDGVIPVPARHLARREASVFQKLSVHEGKQITENGTDTCQSASEFDTQVLIHRTMQTLIHINFLSSLLIGSMPDYRKMLTEPSL